MTTASQRRRERYLRDRATPEYREWKRLYDLQYRAVHRQEQRDYAKAYAASHPGALRDRKTRIRARRAGAVGSHTNAEWIEKRDLFGRCFYCGSPGPLFRDHMTPLSRGGSDFIWNVVPSCGPCNSRKHTQTAWEFLEERAA